jgi:hypothetical protein
MSAELATRSVTKAMDPAERLEYERLVDDLRRVAGIKAEAASSVTLLAFLGAE